LIAAMRPALVVELGSFYGESYFGFCQALDENAIQCRCYAVDTWQGDGHGGIYGEEIYADVKAYNGEHYSSFSQLLRMTFDEALASFADGSIDILHIDGFHSYEAVRHDFESWLPKVRPGGIVLLHDISIRSAEFGVWRFWEELRPRFAAFEFRHSAGLGVILKPGGDGSSSFVSSLFKADCARYYEASAERLHLLHSNTELRHRLAKPFECAMQVFSSSAQGYTEENSAIRVVEAGSWKEINFELPTGLGTQPLRIDPADRACITEIRRIVISSACGPDVLWTWDGADPAPAMQVAGTGRILDTAGAIKILSDGADPQLLLHAVAGPLYHRPLRLELTVRITPALTGMESDLARAVSTLDARVTRLSDQLNRDVATHAELLQTREELAAAHKTAEAETARRKHIEESLWWRATAAARFIASKFPRVPR
jgi:hypothetical protein